MAVETAQTIAVRRASYREVFGVRDFRLLWSAQLLSRAGDQLAAVALAVLVFDRTGSPFYSAAAYGATFLPWAIGGPLLSGLADRYPRRRVMICCDLIRAVLVAAMAMPEIPLVALFGMLVLVGLADPPFSAARAALVPEVLAGDRYTVGASVITMTNELAQVGGFVVGGALVAGLSPSGALLVDAVTYLLSAFVLCRLRPRPAADAAGAPDRIAPSGLLRRTADDVRTGVRLIVGDPQLRRLTGLAWLCAFYVVPEALAVVYAASTGAGPVAVGLLLAANPAGTVCGSWWLGRFVAPGTRLRLMGPLAVLSCAPLIGCALAPPWWGAALLWFLSGVGSAYNLPANASFVAAVPARRRGQAFGLVASGMAFGQGAALLLAGAAAASLPAGIVIAWAGAAGTVASVCLAVRLRREPVGDSGRSGEPA